MTQGVALPTPCHPEEAVPQVRDGTTRDLRCGEGGDGWSGEIPPPPFGGTRNDKRQGATRNDTKWRGAGMTTDEAGWVGTALRKGP